MIANSSFEIVKIADEYMAVPIGEKASTFGGVVALTEAAAFLLEKLNTNQKESELLYLLTQEYDISEDIAKADLKLILSTFRDLGLIED